MLSIRSIGAVSQQRYAAPAFSSTKAQVEVTQQAMDASFHLAYNAANWWTDIAKAEQTARNGRADTAPKPRGPQVDEASFEKFNIALGKAIRTALLRDEPNPGGLEISYDHDLTGLLKQGMDNAELAPTVAVSLGLLLPSKSGLTIHNGEIMANRQFQANTTIYTLPDALKGALKYA